MLQRISPLLAPLPLGCSWPLLAAGSWLPIWLSPPPQLCPVEHMPWTALCQGMKRSCSGPPCLAAAMQPCLLLCRYRYETQLSQSRTMLSTTVLACLPPEGCEPLSLSWAAKSWLKTCNNKATALCRHWQAPCSIHHNCFRPSVYGPTDPLVWQEQPLSAAAACVPRRSARLAAKPALPQQPSAGQKASIAAAAKRQCPAAMPHCPGLAGLTSDKRRLAGSCRRTHNKRSKHA